MLRLVYKLRFPVQTVQTSLVIKALTGAPPTARYYVHHTPLNGVKARLSIVATFQHSVRPEHTIASTTASCTVATLARQFLFTAHITTPENATWVLLDATITAPFIVPKVPKECILIYKAYYIYLIIHIKSDFIGYNTQITAMSTLLILRNTFRMHDNAALHTALQDAQCKTILIPIDTQRVLSPTKCLPIIDDTKIIQPRFYTHSSTNHYAWGYHQYYFLLHIIRTFVDDLHTHYPHLTVVVAKETVPKMLSKHIRQHTKCIYDSVDDPAWEPFDKMLRQHFSTPQQHHCVVTHTLLDWFQTDHKAFLESWSPKRHNKSFKDYVFSQSFDFDKELQQTDCRSPLRHTTNNKRTGERLEQHKNTRRSPKASQRTTQNTPIQKKNTKRSSSSFSLSTEIQKWRKAMVKNNLVPFEPPLHTTCEQWALDQLTAHATTMASNQWEKPKTQSVLSVRDYGTKPEHTTSKLSPFFALGALSAKHAYVHWQGTTVQQHKQNASRPSSAIAQLLWREEFHASSLAEGFWHTRDDDANTRFWKRDKEWCIWKGDDDKLQPFLHAQATKPPKSKTNKAHAASQTSSEATLMQDTNSSLLMLVRDGWIHHLRRHTVADYLTRGYLNADWMLGESWFRQTLLDHDASINRANWLWLSACDFSTKQLCMHYNHENYVRRQSGQKIVS